MARTARQPTRFNRYAPAPCFELLVRHLSALSCHRQTASAHTDRTLPGYPGEFPVGKNLEQPAPRPASEFVIGANSMLGHRTRPKTETIRQGTDEADG